MIKGLWLWFRRHFRKLMPLIVIVTLAVIAGVTDVFGVSVQETVRSTAQELANQLKPMMAKLLIALFLLYVSWFVYHPFTAAVERLLCKSGASQRGRDLAVKLLKFVFWALVLFLVFTFAAAEFFGKFVVGFGVFTAAMTLALQGAANDFICGLLLQFTKKFLEGDNIVVEGLSVQGKVTSVGYLSTVVDAPNAVVHVPNREVWARAVRVLKPEAPKSLIILPPGVELPAAQKE